MQRLPQSLKGVIGVAKGTYGKECKNAQELYDVILGHYDSNIRTGTNKQRSNAVVRLSSLESHKAESMEFIKYLFMPKEQTKLLEEFKQSFIKEMYVREIQREHELITRIRRQMVMRLKHIHEVKHNSVFTNVNDQNIVYEFCQCGACRGRNLDTNEIIESWFFID